MVQWLFTLNCVIGGRVRNNGRMEIYGTYNESEDGIINLFEGGIIEGNISNEGTMEVAGTIQYTSNEIKAMVNSGTINVSPTG